MITLEDVILQRGLPIDGPAVIGPCMELRLYIGKNIVRYSWDFDLQLMIFWKQFENNLSSGIYQRYWQLIPLKYSLRSVQYH